MRGGKIELIGKTWIFFLLSHFLFPMISLADYSFKFNPRISVSQVYDDNINLDHTNEKSDHMTTVSAGINMMVSSFNNSLIFNYAPTLVWYHENDENNTVRQAYTLNFWQNMAENVRFDLANTYFLSEEPLEPDEEVGSARVTRQKYQRNSGSVSLRYQFGPEDSLNFGYRHNLLENEDPTLDDGIIQNPFAMITYWPDIKNGLELDYIFTNANFWRDDGTEPGDDYTGHGAGIRYLYRFTPHASGSLRYHFTKRDFDGLTEDYNIHEGSINFEQDFSSELSLSLGGSLFTLVQEQSNDETDYTYNISLTKRLQRGGFTIGGRGGWREAYLEAERRGLILFWSSDLRLQYQPIKGYTPMWAASSGKTEIRRIGNGRPGGVIVG
jgi:hypothetical protein